MGSRGASAALGASQASVSAEINSGKGASLDERINKIVSRLDSGDYKSAAERAKLEKEYTRLNSERSVATIRRFNKRNNIKDVWQ